MQAGQDCVRRYAPCAWQRLVTVEELWQCKGAAALMRGVLQFVDGGKKALAAAEADSDQPRAHSREEDGGARSLRTFLESFITEEFLPEVYVTFRWESYLQPSQPWACNSHLLMLVGWSTATNDRKVLQVTCVNEWPSQSMKFGQGKLLGRSDKFRWLWTC